MRPKLEHKTFAINLKEDTAPDIEPEDDKPVEEQEPTIESLTADGTFRGYASTWDEDLYGDRIIRGAFTDTLAERFPEHGAHIPIHWQHKEGSPFDVIGETISAVEDEHGLLIEGRLDTDTYEGARTYDLLKRGLITQMSIGFLPEETAWVDTGEWDGYREIRKAKLFEISVVQVAANQAAEITEVKSAPEATTAEGRTISVERKASTINKVSDLLSLEQKGTRMGMKEQLAAAKRNAADLIAKGADALTDEEHEQLKALHGQIERLNGRLSVFKEVQEDTTDGQDVKQPGDTVKEPHMEAKSIGDLYAMTLKQRGMSVLDTKSHGLRTPEFKAATDTHVAGGAGYQPLTQQIDTNGVWPFERPLVVADLFSQGTMTGSSIKYPVYPAFTGTPKQVKEGAKKTQIHMDDPTWVNDTLHEIAAFWKISDDMAEDLPYVVSEINAHAQYNLSLQEEIDLLTSDGTNDTLTGLLHRTGIQTMDKDNDDDPDRIFKAFTKIAEKTGFPADAIVINPADYETIRLGKDSNGQYYGGGYFAGAYGNGGVLQNPSLWGVRTVVTPAVGAGTVIVGAFTPGGTVYRKGGLIAESTNSNEDDFVNDKIAFRIKERIALQVKYPAAFVKVTLGKAPTAK